MLGICDRSGEDPLCHNSVCFLGCAACAVTNGTARHHTEPQRQQRTYTACTVLCWAAFYLLCVWEPSSRKGGSMLGSGPEASGSNRGSCHTMRWMRSFWGATGTEQCLLVVCRLCTSVADHLLYLGAKMYHRPEAPC